ncbi:MAG: peptide-methionine (S)-S-oxide reductase MsrA [Pseudobdellovibrio sp.]
MQLIKLSLTLIFILAVGSPSFSKTKAPNQESVVFAAGCFWGVEEIFRKVDGVVETGVGYTGGTTKNPTYGDTTTGKTGHAEAVEVIYDSKKVSFEKLLDLFFKMHDPTTLNAQGNDKGTQYRSAIFYRSEKQKNEALAFVKKVEKSKAWKNPIVTEVTAAGIFFEAEEEHQKYLLRNPKGYDNHYLRKISFDLKK